MPKTLKYSGIFMLVLSGVTTAHAQIHKCTVEGQVIYQAEPCVGKGVSGKEVKIQSTALGSSAPPVTKAEPTQDKPAQPSPSAPVVPIQEAATKPKTQMEREAERCLAWYKPKLRDPKNAYYSDVSKEGRVLSMSLHATNGYGGFKVSTVACEIHNGSLDEGWTKIHAERAKW